VKTRRRPTAVAVLLLALTGCRGQRGDGIAVSIERSVELEPPFEEGETVRARIRADGLLEITTLGSGSCPYVPIDLDRKARDRIAVTMKKRGGDCTDDLGPTSATVRLPDDVEYRDRPLRVDIDGVGREVSLAVRLGFGSDGEPEGVLGSLSACEALLADPRLAGMRLVEAMSYGSARSLCLYADENARTAAATATSPVPGKRAEVGSDGTAVITDTRFTRPPIDPGDTGPTAPR
jgi:hypothetical protein